MRASADPAAWIPGRGGEAADLERQRHTGALSNLHEQKPADNVKRGTDECTSPLLLSEGLVE